MPATILGVVPKLAVLLAALVAVLVLEILRHVAGLELPALRDYERDRPASFVFYAVALFVAVVLFPLPVAVAVVLTTSLVDPLVGELRQARRSSSLYPSVPFAAYVGLAVAGLGAVGRWPVAGALVLAVGAAALGLAVERPKLRWVDDDLAMVFVPAAFLWGIGIGLLHYPA